MLVMMKVPFSAMFFHLCCIKKFMMPLILFTVMISPFKCYSFKCGYTVFWYHFMSETRSYGCNSHDHTPES